MDAEHQEQGDILVAVVGCLRRVAHPTCRMYAVRGGAVLVRPLVDCDFLASLHAAPVLHAARHMYSQDHTLRPGVIAPNCMWAFGSRRRRAQRSRLACLAQTIIPTFTVFLLLGVSLIASANQVGVGTVEDKEPQRFQGVVRQSLDKSCGAAALATILRYHHGLSVTEEDIIVHILTDRQKAGRPLDSGFSFLELLRTAQAFGVQGRGFRLTGHPEQFLHGLASPIIVHISRLEYSHFVVVRGVSSGTVFVADPAIGNFRMTVDRFLHIWRDRADAPGLRSFLAFQPASGASNLWLRFAEPFVPPELGLIRRR